MSILIKGMEMPASCLLCPHHEHGTIHEWELYCGFTGDYIGHWDDKSLNNGHRPDFCPLVEVSEKAVSPCEECPFIKAEEGEAHEVN